MRDECGEYAVAADRNRQTRVPFTRSAYRPESRTHLA